MASLIMTSGWRRWISDHIPTSEEATSIGTIELYDELFDTSSSNLYICVDATPKNLQWQKIIGNKASGSVTLIGGQAIVSYPEITATNSIFLNVRSASGVSGALYTKGPVVGVGFTIFSTSALDTSTVGWEIQ
jgi:hypothetical protein